MTGGSTQSLIVLESKIEAQIKAMSRRLRGDGPSRATTPTSREDIIDRLGDRRLISYFNYGGDIHAVSVHHGFINLKRLVDADRAADEVSSLLSR